MGLPTRFSTPSEHCHTRATPSGDNAQSYLYNGLLYLNYLNCKIHYIKTFFKVTYIKIRSHWYFLKIYRGHKITTWSFLWSSSNVRWCRCERQNNFWILFAVHTCIIIQTLLNISIEKLKRDHPNMLVWSRNEGGGCHASIKRTVVTLSS